MHNIKKINTKQNIRATGLNVLRDFRSRLSLKSLKGEY